MARCTRDGMALKSRNGPKYFEDLVYFGVAGKQRLPLAHHLGKYTAYRPHVDGGRVVATSQENFRGSVPECHDLCKSNSAFKPHMTKEIERTSWV